MIYFISFAVTFFFVFAKAFQQRNVIGDKFWSIIPVSYVMAAGEYFIKGIIVLVVIDEGLIQGLGLILVNGTGGWMGCHLAMYAHRRIFNA